jgi:hypothetical protein
MVQATETQLPTAKKPYDPPEPGDTLTLWTWNMSVMPPTQYQARFLVAGKGVHCYVMVHDSVWGAGLVDSAGVARIVDRFDSSSPRDSTKGVWDHNTEVLGDPPDALDQDSLIYLLYYNIGTFMGSSFDGFWMSFDEYYDSTSMRLWGYHSNEIECVYLDCYPNDPSDDYRIAIAAHEFGHMIHWNYDQAESLWVQEGCCELAMWLYGAPDPISSFPGSCDNDLTRWTGAWADYIKTYLWFLFLYEQYGERVGNELVRNIIESPAISIDGINAGFDSVGLAVRFEDAFDQWVLANRIRDTSYFGGRYGYYGEDVPFFVVAGYHTSYPVSRIGSLNRWAGEYLLFQNAVGLDLEFDGADAADFRLFLFAEDTIRHLALLDTIPLDSVQHGQVILGGLDTLYQSVFLVPANHTAFGTMSYQYSAAASGIREGPRLGDKAAGPASMLVRAGAVLETQGEFQILSSAGRVVVQGSDRISTIRLAPGVYYILSARSCLPSRRLVVAR